jgi:hypothetical protein
MASQSGFVVENKFTQGLVTESTALTFPTEACTDVINCVFDEFGKVTRRPGLDQEVDGVLNTITIGLADTDVWQDYVWYTSAATSNKAFLVQQHGRSLDFYDITNSTNASATLVTTLNLNSYLPSGSPLSSSSIACQFATGNGDLIISNQNINPIYCTYNETTTAIDVTQISLKYRDTDGLNDGLTASQRPTETVSSLKTNNPNHYYNLLNQGWGANTSEALTQWDANNTFLPSNADAIAYYRADQKDPYLVDSAVGTDPGNSPAPRGHFILGVGEDDRIGAAAADGYSGFTPTSNTGSTLISKSAGSIIGNATNASRAFDGNSNQPASQSAITSSTSDMWIGKNLTSISGSKISGVVVSPSNNDGFANSGGVTITLQLYAKTTAPANSTDGTLLGSLSSFPDTRDSAKFIASNNTSTTYNYVWVRVTRSTGASDSFRVAELDILAPGGSFYRPKCCAFFAGRAWYAGVDGPSIGANVYFSQVVTTKDKYGLCYQSNDPTSEKFADLLATDGGVIKIPEMGKVQRLFAFQNSLLVFANNGVWQIGGSGNDGFAATGYRVRRLTNIGMTSPNSVVDVKGVPMWWAEDGIYTINYDPNYDSSAIKSLTEESIKSYVLSVPPVNRQYIRSTFDRLNNYVYFSFLDTPATSQNQGQSFNNLLVFNAKTSAWFPWKFDNTTSNVPIFMGLEYITDGNRQLTGSVKLTTKVTVSSTTYLTYSDFHDNVLWKDFDVLMALNSGNEIDYSSYLVAGYRIDGQAMRNFQSKYVWTFMNNESGASLWLRGIWDFTNNANSGKWSTPQQAYNSLTTKGRLYDDVRISRRVVRGTGKALQIKYYSESGKPFTLIGWGLFEEGNDAT